MRCRRVFYLSALFVLSCHIQQLQDTNYSQELKHRIKINTIGVLDGNVAPQDLKMRAKACSTYYSTLPKSCSIYISGQWFSSATTPKNNGTYKVSKPNYSLEYGILDSRPFLLEDAQIFRSHACSKFSRLSKYTVYGFVFPRSRYVHRKPKRLKRPPPNFTIWGRYLSTSWTSS